MIPFLFQDFGSFSLSLFEILYQVDSLSLPLFFGLVGIYPVPLPAWVFLCLFILFILLSLGWLFCILVVCGVLFLWSFLAVGGVVWVACQGFLAREACVGVLVGGAVFLLSGGQ